MGMFLIIMFTVTAFATFTVEEKRAKTIREIEVGRKHIKRMERLRYKRIKQFRRRKNVRKN